MKFLNKFLEKYKALIIPSLIILLICQIIPTYTYWEIESKLNQFKADKIINEKIVGENERHYKPGKWSSKYLEIQLTNGKIYPVLLMDEYKKSEIKIGSIITKKEFSSEFWINNSINFKLEDLTNEKIFNRIFMFIVSIFGIYARYQQTAGKKE